MFLLPVFAAIVLRVYLIFRDSVPFAYDMGRDLLWAKDISFYHIPTLIGPAASIWGVYFGPLWYYFLSVPLFFANGHPVSAVFATASVNLLTAIFAYFMFVKVTGRLYSLVLMIIILFSAASINLSLFAFHANVLPFLTLLMIYFLNQAVTQNPLFLAPVFFAISLMFHADPAPAVIFTSIPIFVFFYFKIFQSRNLPKILIYSSLAYLVPFLPQVIFELRNDFVQTKALVAYFTGQNPSLSGQLPLIQRVPDRLLLFFNFLKDGFFGGNTPFVFLFLAVFAVGLLRSIKAKKNRKLKILFKINFLSLVVSFLLFTIPFSVEVKNWYLNGLVLIFAFLITFSLYGLKNFRLILPFFLIIYLTLNLLSFFRNQRIAALRSDPAQLSNQLKAINLIYNDAKRLPFSVYTFTPSIYDLNWQYLFWWQGYKLKGGLPADFAYLPNKPSYVRNKYLYASASTASGIVYLIIEKGRENPFYTRQNWLREFEAMSLIWEKNINDAISLQKRIK